MLEDEEEENNRLGYDFDKIFQKRKDTKKTLKKRSQKSTLRSIQTRCETLQRKTKMLSQALEVSTNLRQCIKAQLQNDEEVIKSEFDKLRKILDEQEKMTLERYRAQNKSAIESLDQKIDDIFKELEGSRGALQKAEGVIEMSKKKNVDINGDSKTGNDDILDIPLDPSEVKLLKKDVDGHLFIPSDISNDAEYLFQNYSPMLNCKKFEKAVKTINLKKRFSSSFWHIAKFSELIENLSNNTKYSKYSPSFRLHGFNW